MNRKSISMAVFVVVALLCSMMVEGRRTVEKKNRISRNDDRQKQLERQKKLDTTLDQQISFLTPAQKKEVAGLRAKWTKDVTEEAMSTRDVIKEAMRTGDVTKEAMIPNDDNNMTASENSYNAMITKINEYSIENEEKEKQKQKQKQLERQKKLDTTLDQQISFLTPAQKKEVVGLRKKWTKDVTKEAKRPNDDNNETASENSYNAMITKIFEYSIENEEKEKQKQKQKQLERQ
eukprot:Filipodium_phascolosomae@DN2403_c0_g1_i1.p1